jgi:hypothetical protein
MRGAYGKCATNKLLLVAWYWWRIPYAPRISQNSAPPIALFPLVIATSKIVPISIVVKIIVSNEVHINMLFLSNQRG